MIELDLTDLSKCTDHPLTRMLKLFDELKRGEQARVRIRLDAVPLDLLLERAHDKNVDIDVEDYSENVAVLKVVKKT